MGCFFSIILFIVLTRLFGFWGFILWLIIVSVYENNEKQKQKQYTDKKILNIFDNIIQILSSLVIEDNIVTKEEVAFVKDYFMQLFPGKTDIVNQLMLKFKYYNENPEQINLNESLNVLRQLNYNEKLAIFSVIVNLSKYSGGESLKNKIFDIGKKLNISYYEILSIWNMYYTQKKQQTNYYYNVLGLNESVSKEEIRKRYKELVKKYHPDRLRNMPESFQKDAEEKLKRINEAYDIIMKSK